MALRALTVVACVGLGACSLVLDPDELTAERLDGGDGGDTGEIAPDSATLDGVADEVSAPDEIAAPDGDTGKQIIVDHSGAAGCTFDYHNSLTQCPETCAPGWSYVVDAGRSTGVGAFAWTFEATGGFRVTPSGASGARVQLRIDVPECLIGGTNMKPFTILARLSTDGGPAQPIDLPQIGVGFVTSCAGSGTCPAP